MAWGSAQEAASVHALLQVFPNADIGEVRAEGGITARSLLFSVHAALLHRLGQRL